MQYKWAANFSFPFCSSAATISSTPADLMWFDIDINIDILFNVPLIHK